MPESLLLVHDEPIALHSLYRILKRDGRDVLTAANGAEALRLLAAEPVALCLATMRLPDLEGPEFVRRARALRPDVECVLLAPTPDIGLVVAAMRAGAYEVVPARCDARQLEAVVERALARRRAAVPPSAERRAPGAADWILGCSAAMRAVLDLVEQVGPSAATVLIQGESGTGKELVASALQRRSRRSAAPFVKVNCAAIPDGLMESELFGHERGAFTGAVHARKGKFELADGGSLFLDEIGDMSPSTQMKVLRVLQEGEFDRVGGTRTQKVDVRVIAATNRDLGRAVEERRFRADLYYRLRVIEIRLPPLRERREDIPLLVEHFVRKYAERNGKQITGLAPEVLGALLDHDWPGNVRELENTIERAVVLTRTQRLTRADLTPELLQRPLLHAVAFTIGTTLAQVERRMIAETLRHTGGDKTRAAALLGITARTIYRKLERRCRELRADADPGAAAAATAPARADDSRADGALAAAAPECGCDAG